MARFTPLRVTAWLQTPVVTDGTLPLDGILFYQACRDRLGERVASEAGAGGGAGGAPVRLLIKRRGQPDWFYACSFAQWRTPLADGLDHWNKRLDTAYAHLLERAGRVIVEKGAYKAYHHPIRYRAALAVDWYCVGDADWIGAMLRTVTHVGGETGQGWGAVLRWEVAPWDQDWSVAGPGGRLMRAVPDLERGTLHCGYRPSYWLAANQARCRVPDDSPVTPLDNP